MVASTETIKATCHARSNSLPSKSHPLIVSVEDQLQKLRSSELAMVCKSLAALKDLVEGVGNLLQLPLAQKALCNKQKDKSIENFLDGSLRLLDICGNIKDIFVHIKGCVQDLESSLCRRNGLESGLANEIEKYFISRKKVNKIVCKGADNLKIVQKGNLALLDEVRELVDLVGLLS